MLGAFQQPVDLTRGLKPGVGVAEKIVTFLLDEVRGNESHHLASVSLRGLEVLDCRHSAGGVAGD